MTVLALAHRLGRRVEDIEAMPIETFVEWVAYFALINAPRG